MRNRQLIMMAAFVLPIILVATSSFAQQAGTVLSQTTPSVQQKSTATNQSSSSGTTMSGQTQNQSRGRNLWADMSPDQKKQIRTMRLDFARKMEGLRADMSKKRIELMELKLADQPDDQAIEKKYEELWTIKDQARKEKRDFMKKLRSVLTPEQRQQFHSGYGSCPMCGQGFGGGMMGGMGRKGMMWNCPMMQGMGGMQGMMGGMQGMQGMGGMMRGMGGHHGRGMMGGPGMSSDSGSSSNMMSSSSSDSQNGSYASSGPGDGMVEIWEFDDADE